MNWDIEKVLDILSQSRERFERAARMQIAVWNGEKMKTQPLLLNR